MARVAEAAYIAEAARALVKAEQDLERRSGAEGAVDWRDASPKRLASLRNAVATAAEHRDRCQHELLCRLIEVNMLPDLEVGGDATRRYFGCDWKDSYRAPDRQRFEAWQEGRR